MHPFRSHTCGDLRKSHIGDAARLSGWIHRMRDHGGILFIDLRDHYGITQIVVRPDLACFDAASQLKPESVACFTGAVISRDPDTYNPKIPTGEVELDANEMELLGPADVLPFPVAEETVCPEATRLKHRFLDLRRDSLHRNIQLRAAVISAIRRHMTDMGFLEIQTPILTSSSPEGARDYLVPSRLHPGKFYALPQAPQQFKQLLMVAGFDRYFQIAPCFRDEDARADRSPGEFYQLDVEMSFVTQDDVFEAIETVITKLFSEFADSASEAPFERITYEQAMAEFGCDKPDLRNPLRMIDVTEIFGGADLKAFASVVEKGGIVRAIRLPGGADLPRKFFDDMITFTQEEAGGKGLAYIGWQDGTPRSPIAKFLSQDELEALKTAAGIEDGDIMFFIADSADKTPVIGAAVIAELAKRQDLLEKGEFRFCWIVDYPMFEKDSDTGTIGFSHNPFSMPQGGLEALEAEDPLQVKAWQYDLVCNGLELSSGAIRNHSPEIMYKAFAIAGYSTEEVDDKFGGMIRAFRLGAPPHGGLAPGIDRIVMLLAGTPNIREVIAFPFNQQAQDLMMNAPSDVSERQLKELHIRTVVPPPGGRD